MSVAREQSAPSGAAGCMHLDSRATKVEGIETRVAGYS